MIRVLVVEDSAVIREFLLHGLQSDPEIQVIGTAENGEEALRAVEQMRPDVITMDVHMPKMNGLDATRRIMETRPTPIVIVSGTADGNEMSNAFRAIEAGALAVLPRPVRMGHAAHHDGVADLIQMLKLMAEVKVVRRRERPQREAISPPIQFRLESRSGRRQRRSNWWRWARRPEALRCFAAFCLAFHGIFQRPF